jgi:predicted HicB family RNase H-like nuclease
MGKTIKSNPASSYLTQPEQPQEQAAATATQPEPQEKPQGSYAEFRRTRETRSQRMQIVLTPTLTARVKTMAKSYSYSVNDLINTLLEEAVINAGY